MMKKVKESDLTYSWMNEWLWFLFQWKQNHVKILIFAILNSHTYWGSYNIIDSLTEFVMPQPPLEGMVT